MPFGWAISQWRRNIGARMYGLTATLSEQPRPKPLFDLPHLHLNMLHRAAIALQHIVDLIAQSAPRHLFSAQSGEQHKRTLFIHFVRCKQPLEPIETIREIAFPA